jgi:tRNA(Ile)-lysidine synthase
MRGAVELKMGRRMIQVERPLLSVRKSDLDAWMRSRNLIWREDATNAVNDVVRNRLRNEAIPLLSGIAKRDVAPMLARAAVGGEDWEKMMDWALEKADVIDPQGRLHLKALSGLPDALMMYAIGDFLKTSGVGGISKALLERCVGLCEITAPPSVNLPGGGRMRRRAGRIFIEGV